LRRSRIGENAGNCRFAVAERHFLRHAAPESAVDGGMNKKGKKT
jgi:hypothetical protein